ncbi:CDP-alcohol phosphatidyltransferase family protein, partial [Mesorhizobium sp. M2D.F.Ca.ET.160.01.1.1]
MPTLYALKPAFQDRLRPLVERLATIGITANGITILAALLSIAAGTAIALLPGWRIVLLLIPVVLF